MKTEKGGGRLPFFISIQVFRKFQKALYLLIFSFYLARQTGDFIELFLHDKSTHRLISLEKLLIHILETIKLTILF